MEAASSGAPIVASGGRGVAGRVNGVGPVRAPRLEMRPSRRVVPEELSFGVRPNQEAK